MTGVSEPVDNSESLILQPALPEAPEQNTIPFDNLLTIFQGTSENNSSASPLATLIRESEKRFPADLSSPIERKNKKNSKGDETDATTSPASLSNTCNLLSIAGNLRVEIEQDTNQCLIVANNTEGRSSYTTESPDGNTSQKRFLMNDVQVFNETPFLPKSEQKEGSGMEAAQGVTPPDDKGSLQGNIQTQLLETTLKSLPDDEVLVSLEQFEREWLMDKDNCVKPIETNSCSTKDPQVISSLKANGSTQINSGFPKDQCMILEEERNNDAHILSGKLFLKASTDTVSSSPLEIHVLGKQIIQSKGDNAITDAEKYFILKNGEPRINPVSFVTGEEVKNNMVLREKYYLASPKVVFPTPVEEIQSPPDATSLKSTIVSVISSLIEDIVKREGSTEIEQSKSQTPDTIIMETGNVLPLFDNNRSENAPSRVHILRNQHADTFVLPKKGDASIEVSLKPEGMGQIDIELTLDRGVINAQINTSEVIGKEIIERNLHAILNSLIDEGLSVGSLSVSLRNRPDDMSYTDRKEVPEILPAMTSAKIPFAISHNRIISIFV